MKRQCYILTLLLLFGPLTIIKAQTETRSINFDFLGNPVHISIENSFSVPFDNSLSQTSIQSFYEKLNSCNYKPVIDELISLRNKEKLDDWLFYQLIRKTAQQISPKADNYYRYTLYKWFFLTQSGYDAFLRICNRKILFYVQSDENIYNIPYVVKNNKQYVCLNYHDYGYNIDFENEKFADISIVVPGAIQSFSYKVTGLPQFRTDEYMEKDFQFTYGEKNYQFRLKLNPFIKTIFTNYPVVDYELYFNVPMSNETYSSLIPLLKNDVKGMSAKRGVDYLMHFTREAFQFKPDTENFGQEKRLTPEQTLLYEQSDCEDRAALFFYLVKEIYNLPMIVLVFPEHVTIAVKFDKPVGKPIIYNGEKYSVCEPTPQRKNLSLGRLLPEFKKSPYEIAYAYQPADK